MSGGGNVLRRSPKIRPGGAHVWVKQGRNGPPANGWIFQNSRKRLKDTTHMANLRAERNCSMFAICEPVKWGVRHLRTVGFSRSGGKRGGKKFLKPICVLPSRFLAPFRPGRPSEQERYFPKPMRIYYIR